MICRFISRDSLQKRKIYRRSPVESVSQFASFEMCEVYSSRYSVFNASSIGQLGLCLLYVWYMFKSNVKIRKMNWDKFDALSIPIYVTVQDLDHAIRRGQSKRKTVLAQFSNDSTNAVSTEIHNRTVDELKISARDWMNLRSRIIHIRQRIEKDSTREKFGFEVINSRTHRTNEEKARFFGAVRTKSRPQREAGDEHV